MQTQQKSIGNSPTLSLVAKNEIVLYPIPPSKLRMIFPHVQKLLEQLVARSNGRYSMRGIAQKLASEHWILWVVSDGSVRAVLATELYLDISGMKCCMIRFCTGAGAKDWTHLIDHIEDWARREGCGRLDMLARKGWAKHLPEFKMSHVFLEKDLTDGR